MRFPMPHYPCDFEIPDDWISQAGLSGFTPSAPGYRSATQALLIPLTAIEPVPRFMNTAKDWRGFERQRLVRLLRGFIANDEIEAVPLFELSIFEFAHTPYRYRVLNGFHRFYGSIAAGFSHLPATV